MCKGSEAGRSVAGFTNGKKFSSTTVQREGKTMA